MNKTYILEEGPPAVSWPDYRQKVDSAWRALLDSSEGHGEKTVQTFLEKHPCMVPGGQGMSGPSGHSCFPAALITQPRLSGNGEWVPDFLWIATDSMNIYAVFIEIEAPSKKIFTSRGVQTAEFTQAQNQLAQWKLWISEPSNQQQFFNTYCSGFSYPHRAFVPQYVLIYGRRSEFEGKEQLNRLRSEMEREHEFHMTFDRLHPIYDQRQYMTVRRGKDGYQAVSIPATLELGPLMAEYRSLIQGKDKIVSETSYLSEERKAFLLRRFEYWDQWAKEQHKGIIKLGDRE